MTRDDGAGVFLQVPFEPGDALGVEVVGRLVEQQEVGPFEQDLAEGDAAALAAGERGDVGVAGRQPHGVHGDLDAAVEVPALGGLDGVLDLGLLLEQRVHLVGVGPLAEPGVDLVEPVEKGADRRDGLLDVAADVEARVERRLLGHVADGDPRRRPRRAEEVLVEPGHDPQQRALARAVAADHADLGPRVERQPDVLEDFLLAVRPWRGFDRENILWRHGVWMSWC